MIFSSLLSSNKYFWVYTGLSINIYVAQDIAPPFVLCVMCNTFV